MANTLEGFLSAIRRFFFYSFDLIELPWCLMERAGHAFFWNSVYLGPLQSAMIIAVPFWCICIFETQWFASANLPPGYDPGTMAGLNTEHRRPFPILLQLALPDVRLFLGSGSGLGIILEKFDFYLLAITVRVVVFLVFFFSVVISLLCFIVYNCVLHLSPSMF